MKLTRLELVQRILSALDSENVTEVGTTTESEQVALILDTVYQEILSRFVWKNLYEKRSLELTATPNELKIPEDVLHIEWFRYNKQNVEYVDPMRMTEILDGRDPTDSDVDSVGALTNRDPYYWTTFDDQYVVVDSYNTQLVSNLSDCMCVIDPGKMTQDTDYPFLPPQFHHVLLYGAMAHAFAQLKGDDSLASRYGRLYLDGIASMKRWARKYNVKDTTGRTIDYGRKA